MNCPTDFDHIPANRANPPVWVNPDVARLKREMLHLQLRADTLHNLLISPAFDVDPRTAMLEMLFNMRRKGIQLEAQLERLTKPMLD